MLAHYEIKNFNLGKLKESLDRCWLNKGKFHSSSVAITSNGEYYSGLMESKTHLLDISSEQGALVCAVSCKDPHVKEIVTLVAGEFSLNPIIVKVLCDHVRRTGTYIKYKVYNLEGSELLNLDVMDTYYRPEIKVLEKISSWEKRECKKKYDESKDLKEQLKECALLGMETHFSSSTKTCYGGSVLSGGWIYFGGVYSSFDHRMNLHSEMSAFFCALADGCKDVEAIGLVSTKFVSEVPQMCGCCRQFFSEINKEVMFYGFSMDGTKVFEKNLKEYLPSAWDSNI
jgi:cytidine deaminase